ncbi:MAG: hypothetical protein ACOC8R_02330 [Desulfosalsimonas sp.]
MSTSQHALRDRKDITVESLFFVNQAVKLFSLYLVQYGCGLLAVYKSVKVNYTRKISHFCLFLIPLFLDELIVYERTIGVFLAGAVISIATLLIYISPVRRRIPVINMMFAGFDRPEDRPMTLLWLSTQVIAGYLVIIPFLVLYVFYDMVHLILVPVLITAIGDGLAEPVGVRFGRHAYRVNALFSDKKYHRTLEGSACVFVASVGVIALYHDSFTMPQFAAAMMVVPPAMTLTEAFSPHTWDTPTLFLAGYLILFGIMFI